MSLSECRIISIPRIEDRRGNLCYIQEPLIPFAIQRIYYLFDVPGGADRGGHAHKKLEQLIIATSGSFDITLRDGREQHRYHLSRPSVGLYVCPMIWRELDNFSSGSTCMVLASRVFEADDYIRDLNEFTQLTNQPKQ